MGTANKGSYCYDDEIKLPSTYLFKKRYEKLIKDINRYPQEVAKKTLSDNLQPIQLLIQRDIEEIIKEAIKNSCDAGATRIKIKTKRSKRAITIVVGDNGLGIHCPSTKTKKRFRHLAGGKGIGITQFKESIEQGEINGKIKLLRTEYGAILGVKLIY